MKNLGLENRARRRAVKLVLMATVAMVAVPGGPSVAQTAPEGGEATEVVVTGVRRAIVQGLESKRKSDVIVESIKSEEIGKFPDANLAEALQRVPGIAIDRDGGEGRYVTIRGLGPDLNTVLINGRRIANDSSNRSFSFDTIASDLIGGINVYKTQQSFLREGGVGGTVDIRTTRPLDRKGFRASGRAEALFENNSEKFTPQASVIVSDTFLNDTLGIQAALSHQSRENRTYQVNTSSLRTMDVFRIGPGVQVLNAYRPQELNRNVIDEQRTRTGFTGALQYRPNDSIEFNFDYLYSKFNTETYTNQASNFFFALDAPKSAAPYIASLGPQYAAEAARVAANSRTEVDSNGVVTQFSVNPGKGSQVFNAEEHFRPSTTQMVGGNVKWNLSEKLTLTLDGAVSTAKLDNRGLDKRRSLEILDTGSYFVDLTGEVPAITELNTGLVASPDNYAKLGVRYQFDSGTYVEATNKEISAQFDYEASGDLKFRAGVLREIGEKTSDSYLTDPLLSNLYQSTLTKVPSLAVLEQITSGIINPDPANFGMPATAHNETFLIDVAAYDAWMSDPATLATLQASYPGQATAIAAFRANGSSFKAQRQGVSYAVNESVTSLYFDVNKKLAILGVPSSLTVGARYSETNVTGVGYSQVLIGLVPAPGSTDPSALLGVFAPANGPQGLTRLTAENVYHNWLPSANLKVDLTDDVVIRFAASKSLSRPELDDLAPKFTFGGLSTTSRSAKSNNPDLKPMVSTNLDFASEWYYSHGNAVTFDIFWKKLEDMIVAEVVPGVVIDTVTNPALNTFTVTRPSNAAVAKVWGATIGWTQSFDFGLGFQTNYTWVDTDRKFDPSYYDPTEVTLPGLSDTLNAVVFFERGPFSARIAYNWRASFLRSTSFPGGNNGSMLEPRFAKSYDQVDARVSYNLGRRYQVYLEGVNLTNSVLAEHGRFENLFISRENFGSRVIVGLSGKF